MRYLMLVTAMLIGMGSAFGGKDIGPTGDDLFPWPKTSVCPFPWSKIDGSYVVRKQVGAAYEGHTLQFSAMRAASDGRQVLSIRQYNKQGSLFADGTGQPLPEDHDTVRGVLKTKVGRAVPYVVYLRNYKVFSNSGCKDSNAVTAVVFCRLRGTCAEDSLLEKLDEAGSVE